MCGVLCVKGTRVHNIQGQDPYSIGSKLDVCIQSRKYIAATYGQLYLMNIL
jgi:hypothetical protein